VKLVGFMIELCIKTLCFIPIKLPRVHVFWGYGTMGDLGRLPNMSEIENQTSLTINENR